jgi:RNA polymerase sigma-70 factor (ECF subfamily)
MEPSATRYPPRPAREAFALAPGADEFDLSATAEDETSPEVDEFGPEDPFEATLPLERAALETLDNAALAILISRVMRQDEAALAALYEQLSGRVYAVALHITREVACAEEVLQDTFWQVWRQAPRFDAERGSAVAWVLMMARSRSLDALRARARDLVHTQPQSDEDEKASADEAAADPLDLLHAVRREGALHAQLALLDPMRRQLIALAFFRGMTHDEIADHTGLPLGTVKSHFRRTLAALQAALGPDFSRTAAGSPR